jgi:hypothetical protein
MNLLKEVVQFIDDNSKLTLYHCDFFENIKEYEEEENHIMFQTRENGCVGSETTGQEDVDEAYRIMKAVNEKFKHSFKLEVEEVDEWVSLTINY